LKKLFKVVLVSLYSFKYSAMGVRQLHSILTEKGHDVHTIFFKPYDYTGSPAPTEKEYSLFLEKITALAPDLVGISFYTTLFEFAKRITADIRKTIKTKIIWGGIHATISPDQCVEYADFVNLGEGYHSLPALVDSLIKGVDDTAIPNIWFRTAHGIIKNDIGPLWKNLDALPFTDYTDQNKLYINKDRLTERNEFSNIDSNYYIMSALGCPFHCTYCCNSVLQKAYSRKGSYIRRRSVDHVIRELEAVIRNPNITFIEFWDDVFTFQHDWLEEFCAKYKAKIGLPFSCYAHPSFLNEKIVKLLADTGLKKTTIGVQSGSEEFRRTIYERNEKNDAIIEAGKLFRKYLVLVNYDFIIGNPLETDDDKRNTFLFITRLPHPLTLAVSDLLFFPRHKLTEELLEKNLIGEKDVEHIRKRALGSFGNIFDISDKKERYWNFLFVLAGYFRLSPGMIAFLQTAFFRRISILAMIPFSWLVMILFFFRHRIPRIYKKFQKIVTSKTGAPSLKRPV
jgi:anaerobic magnesium-protoporphyrin IX monomethyl ester cyclase